MGLKEQIAEQMKSAMKARDRLRLETLRTVRAALMEKEIERRGAGAAMIAEDELQVLTGAAKKRRESIEMFQQGGRADLVEQETRELAIIQEFLPKQMTSDEVMGVVSAILRETQATGPADFGKVMPAVMKQLKGKADGRMVQETVKKALGMA